MPKSGIPLLVWVIWAILIAETVIALSTARWSVAFVSVTALGLTILPALFVERFEIKLPTQFLGAIAVFVFATLFLGEVYDFYERFWWWDIALHFGSAVAFGVIGFLFLFYLFKGDRYAAPPWALAFLAATFAVAIGTVWEIFEFLMDITFGLNMQKSGLVDTMTDLIVDLVGASFGAMAGFIYLIRGRQGRLSALIADFVALNRRFFRRLRSRGE